MMILIHIVQQFIIRQKRDIVSSIGASGMITIASVLVVQELVIKIKGQRMDGLF